MLTNIKKSSFALTLALIMITVFNFVVAQAADKDRIKTLTVTVTHKQKIDTPKLTRDDFFISEDGEAREVVSALPATGANAPLNLAIVIQDDLPQVNNQLAVLRSFIRELPAGSQVMLTYVRGSFVNVVQPFTADLDQAAKQVRAVSGVRPGPASPYVALIDVMKKFNGFKQGRNEILLISSGFDGLDSVGGFGGSPRSNIYLTRAIKHAQQQNITIFSIYSPSSGFGRRPFAINVAQDALNFLSVETGGKAFFLGTGFVTFDAPLKELRQLLDQQYVVAFKSGNEDGFHSLKVKTDYSNIKVETAKGYDAKF